MKEYGPVYTGGEFYIMKDGVHAIGMKEQCITLFKIETNQLVSTLALDKEDIVTFCVSPNENYLAISNKNSLVRIFKMVEDLTEFKNMECIKLFKSQSQLVVQMTFDPSSKLLAVGTSDSHIKIYDVVGGF